MRRLYDFLEQDTRTASLARIAISVVAVLLIWQVVSMVVTNRLLLVPPADVAAALVHEVVDGAMWTNATATVTAVVTSFVVSVAIGVASSAASRAWPSAS